MRALAHRCPDVARPSGMPPARCRTLAEWRRNARGAVGAPGVLQELLASGRLALVLGLLKIVLDVYMLLSVIYIIRHMHLLFHVELYIFHHTPIIMNTHKNIHSTYVHILLAFSGRQLICFTGTRYSIEHNYHNGQRWQSQWLTRMLDLMVSPESHLNIFRRNGPESCFSCRADPHHAAASGGLSCT